VELSPWTADDAPSLGYSWGAGEEGRGLVGIPGDLICFHVIYIISCFLSLS
jgi:hypothetical protein